MTSIKTFSANIRHFACGDNEIWMILTDKTVYRCSYDDVTDWEYMYTYPGASASTLLYVK